MLEDITVFDTETTDLPIWQKPSEGENQPHLVQLAAIRCNHETGEQISSMKVIIKPDGWVSCEESLAIHGITHEQAMEEGIPEEEALFNFLEFCDGSWRNSYNRTFDQRIVRIAIKRYSTQRTEEAWAEKEFFPCSMMMARPILKVPKADGKKGIQNPSLEASYKFFTGKDIEGAHDAMVDTLACKEVYYGCLNWKEKS